MSYNNNIFKDLEERHSSNTVRPLSDQKKRDVLKDKITKTKIPSNTNLFFPHYADFHEEIFNNVIQKREQYKYEKNILTYQGNAPSFLITGCQGAGSIFGDQAGVAKAMKNFMKTQDKQNTFGMLLGDNFYNAGVINETDPLFNRNFYLMYEGLDIPFFNILGNHDYDSHGSPKSVHPMQRAMAQVNHTYTTQSHEGFPQWVMPARYYALSFNNANFFMLDSNTFCFEAEQRSWLENTYKQLNPEGSKKWNILVMHHPLVSYGKRHANTKKGDIERYLLPEYGNIEIPDATMNQWVFETICAMDITFDLELCAHDHFLGFSKIEMSPYAQKNNYSSQNLKLYQQERSWRDNYNELGLPISSDFHDTFYKDILPFNAPKKLEYKNMLAKPKMFQALVGGGGAFPHGLQHKEQAIWTEEHLGFLSLNIGETLELNFHHASRFWGGWNKTGFDIRRDPMNINHLKSLDTPTILQSTALQYSKKTYGQALVWE